LDPHRIAVRAVFAYVVLLGLLRTSGKRTVGQGTPFDFVLALVLGDLIDDVLWAEVSAARFAVAAGVLTLLHTILSVAVARSERFDRLVSGEAVPVLEAGRPRRDMLRRERISLPELERMLRVEGVPPEGWSDVKRALVEVSGQATVERQPWAEAPRKSDLRRLRERMP
jgi:uncharacterized membrane protein YcaP (DUF421 family)